jgi:hypothetical protein
VGAGSADPLARAFERIRAERARLDSETSDLDARLAEWDDHHAADEALDWWNDLGLAIRGEVVNASSVREANNALRGRFEAIFVTSGKTGSPRLDFVLKERAPNAPMVSAIVWADPAEDRERAEAEDVSLVGFSPESFGTTYEWVKPSHSPLYTTSP